MTGTQTQRQTTRQKSDRALKTISEAAELLDVPQHVLRFWETKFTQIKPLKRNGGRRFYRPEDIDTLLKIKFLLYKQGYTIKGAKKVFDQKNLDEVMNGFTAIGKGDGAVHSNDNGPANVTEPANLKQIASSLRGISKALRNQS